MRIHSLAPGDAHTSDVFDFADPTWISDKEVPTSFPQSCDFEIHRNNQRKRREKNATHEENHCSTGRSSPTAQK